MMAVWFITGAGRGFGWEIAREALRRGDQVVATGRDVEAISSAFAGIDGDVLAVELDVAAEGSAERAVEEAMQRFGRIDVLVNNAGHGLLGAIEEVSDTEAREVFDVNVFGLLAVTRAVLPVMRRQRAGRVVNIGSVGGFTTGPGWGVYGATKFAVEGISEALRGELAPLGIAVTVIEPGVFRTDFLDASSLARAQQTIGDYADTAGATRTWADASNQAQPGDPTKAAVAIVDLAAVDDPPLRLQLGADCVARIERKLAFVADELEAWREVALSTAVDEDAVEQNVPPHQPGRERT